MPFGKVVLLLLMQLSLNTLAIQIKAIYVKQRKINTLAPLHRPTKKAIAQPDVIENA